MPAKRTKPEEGPLPPEMTSKQLGRLLGLERVAMSDALFKATAQENGNYETKTVLPIVIAHFRARSERSLNTEARNRQQMADAESAEIKAAQLRNELMQRADNSAIWRDGFIKMIQAIKSASYIPPQSRDKLVKTLREIEVDEPE